MGASVNRPFDVVLMVDLLPFLRIVSATFFSASPVAPASNISASSSALPAVVVDPPTGSNLTGSVGCAGGSGVSATGSATVSTVGAAAAGADDDPLSFWFLAWSSSIAFFDAAVLFS